MIAMMRWIATVATIVMLSGCVYSQEVVQRERYAPGPYYEDAYSGSPEYYREGDSYYTPSYGNRGDYYSGSRYGSSYGSSYGGSYGAGYDSYYGSSFGVSYFDYPFYYSLFWPINRYYYDPFAYPSYHYGVTWFPRNYLGLSLSYNNGWRGHGWLSYSPYRNSWVDSYYDWGRWYNTYPSYRQHYPTPRYGDARIEASRLADLRRPALPRSGRSNQYGYTPEVRQGAATPAYRGNRAADYGRPAAQARQSMRNDGVRRVNEGGSRVAPTTGAFGNPTRGPTTNNPRLDSPRSNAVKGTRRATPASQSEINRLSEQRGTLPRDTNSPSMRERAQADQQGYALPSSRSTPRSAMPSSGASTRPLEYRQQPESRPGVSTMAPTRNVNGVRPVGGDSNTIRGVPVAPRATPRAPGSAPTYYRQAPPTDRPQASPESPRTFIPRQNPATAPNVQPSAPPPSSAPVRSAPVRGVAPAPSRDYEDSSPRSSSTSRSSSSSEKSGVRRVGSERDRDR